MSLRLYTLFLLGLILSEQALSQPEATEYFISVNTNFYLPINPDNTLYPILWYDKGTDPKILIGGFGAGLTLFKPYKNKIKLKGQANISRYKYWDESIDLRDENNQPLGTFFPSATEYTLGITGIGHYYLSDKFSVGTGLGMQILILSMTHLPEDWSGKPTSRGPVAANQFYKPFMPMLPIELSLKFKNRFLGIRYEYAFLNRLKSDLSKYKTDKYGLLFFELGFKIK